MTHDSVPEGWRKGPKALLYIGFSIIMLSLGVAGSYYFESAQAETAKAEMELLFWSLVAGFATTAIATGWQVMTARESRSEQ